MSVVSLGPSHAAMGAERHEQSIMRYVHTYRRYLVYTELYMQDLIWLGPGVGQGETNNKLLVVDYTRKV